MKLTGKQLKQLHDALLSAFDRGDLQRMVRFELDENLGAIAGGGNLSETVFNLIQWAERRGRIGDIIQGAVNYNPDNHDLLAVREALLGAAPVDAPTPLPAKPAPPSPPADDQPDTPYAFAYSAGELGGLAVKASVRLNPVHTAILHLLRKEQHPLVTVDLANHTPGQLRLNVLVEVEGYSRKASKMAPLASGASASLDLFPAFDVAQVATLEELTPASVRVQVEDMAGGARWLDQTLPLQLLAVNSAPLAAWDPVSGKRFDLTPYFGAFVTPNDPELDAFLHDAAVFLPEGHTFSGYQVRDVTPQVQALFDALAARGTVYVDSTLDFNPASATQMTQRVRLPSQALVARTANCIDGVLLMASLLERIGIEPAIVLLPGHALLGWAPYKGSDDWSYLETTLIGRKSFEEAHDMGERKVKPHKIQLEKTGDDRYYRCWPLRDLRARGITPVPKVIGDKLGRIARALETGTR